MGAFTRDLSAFVRPRATRNPKPDRKRVYFNGPADHADGENVNTDGEDIPTLEWSAHAEVETTELTNFIRINWPDDQSEYERETHIERFFSESNPEAYVDVEVIDKVSLKDERSGKKLFLNFTNE